ncbi:lipocalin-like domain-containing protein [Methyloprofundus sp.]|uniref:lipocalin-like domain-containing protein n=1 Tax=Methyloprofundus sp. TaxID=2020875 RepID=UPI003D0FC5C9
MKTVIYSLIIIIIVALGRLFFAQQNSEPPEPLTTSDNLLSADNENYARVLKPRAFVFPQDHGAHPEYHIEWWYFTGILQSSAERKFGYELTFFRFALTPEQQKTASKWRDKQMYMAHFALTDVDAEEFHFAERFSRAGNKLAGAETAKYHVWLHDWKAEAVDTTDSSIHLDAKTEDFSISLYLKPEKKIALQGLDGFSKKNAQAGNASYYYSYTRMATTGNIQLNLQAFEVSGSSWMDREWSSASLAAEQVGWDWFALQLSDHSELMFYRFRRKDDKQDENNAGAIFNADNSKISLTFTEVDIKVLDHWKSPKTQVSYPAKWHLSIPKLGLELDVTPLTSDQEINVRYRYWEGAVSVAGKKYDEVINGQGYVELTGYQ